LLSAKIIEKLKSKLNKENYKKYKYSKLTKNTKTISEAIYFDKRNKDILANIKEASDFYKYCFLCGELMEKPSEEHVIPRWILKEVNLYTQRVKLPNKTTFPFRSLTIPCCLDCNREDLSKLENKVKLIFKKEAKLASAKDEISLFYWLLKIYLALAIKSTQLRKEISNKDSTGILNISQLNELRSLFALMSTLINPTTFDNFTPFSFFIFDINMENYDRKGAFINNPTQHSMLFCLNKIAVMCYFNEDGIIRHIYNDNYLEDRKRTINFDYLVDIYSSGLASMRMTKSFNRSYSTKKGIHSSTKVKTTKSIINKLKGYRLRNDRLKMDYKRYNIDEFG